MKLRNIEMNEVVYSTDPDWQKKCNKCEKPLDDCICAKPMSNTFRNQVAYITRDRKGRGGKTVTVISNLSGDIKSLQKELQKKCASGGALKRSTLEIQGDHVKKIRMILEEKGCKVKQIGG